MPYNAVGDQVTDNTAAIQQAINDVSSMGGGTVCIPAGIYLITATIRHLSNVIVQGVGYSSVILIQKADPTPAWTFTEQSRAQLCNLVIRTQNSIESITLEGYTGLELSQSFFIHIHHVQVWDFNRGIVMSDGTPFSAYNVIGPEVEVNRCDIGIRAWANCNGCMITGSRVFSNLENVEVGRVGRVGLDIENAEGLTVIGTTIEPAQTCLRIRGQRPTCHFLGNYFEPGDSSRLTFDIDVPGSAVSSAIIRGEGNVYNGDGLARLPVSGPHYWDGRSSGSFGAFYSGTAVPKRNLIRNGDLKYWGGFPGNAPNWSVINNPIISEELNDFVTGSRSVRITQNVQGLEGLEVQFVVSDPGIRWVTVGCRYQVIRGTGFFFAANTGEGPRQFADPEPSNGEWQERHLQVPVAPGATTGRVSIIPTTGGEVLIDEVWAVPGRFSVESTQYAERIELLESPIPLLFQDGVTSNEVQGPIDLTNLQTILVPPLNGLFVAPRGVVGCLLRVRIETQNDNLSLLNNFHFAYVDIPGNVIIPGDAIIPAQIHRVYSHWGQQPNEEIVVVRSTQLTGGYQAGDNLSSSYEWHLVGWILA